MRWGQSRGRIIFCPIPHSICLRLRICHIKSSGSIQTPFHFRGTEALINVRTKPSFLFFLSTGRSMYIYIYKFFSVIVVVVGTVTLFINLFSCESCCCCCDSHENYYTLIFYYSIQQQDRLYRLIYWFCCCFFSFVLLLLTFM